MAETEPHTKARVIYKCFHPKKLTHHHLNPEQGHGQENIKKNTYMKEDNLERSMIKNEKISPLTRVSIKQK